MRVMPAEPTTEETANGAPPERPHKYDAFISYSHQADSDLAPQMRAVLQRIAKPWNKRRNLNIFLDKAVLTGTSELGEALNDRIADTKYLVVLLSESRDGVKGSAQSEWVGGEIQEWARAKSKDRIALVCTSGTFVWDREVRDFDFENSTALNPGLRGIYAGQDTEPYILDLRWTRDQERVPGGTKSLDYNHPEFKDYMATLSATIQGTSKDEVFGADRDAFRLARRLKRLAITGLAVLFVASVIAAVVAGFNYLQSEQREREARSGARAADARNNVLPEADLAALLALEGVRVSNTADARGSLAEVLSQPTRFLQRTAVHQKPVTAVAFSDDGRLAATGDTDGLVTVWDVSPDAAAFDQARPRASDPPLQLADQVARLFVLNEEGEDLVAGFDSAGALTVFDLGTGDRESLTPPAEFEGATLSPGGSYLAGLTSDGVLHWYRFEDDLTFTELDGLDLGDVAEAIADVQFSPDEQALAVGLGNQFFVWLLDGDEPAEELLVFERGFESDVNSLAFSPADDPANAVIAVGEIDGAIHLFNRNDLTVQGEVDPRPTDRAQSLSFKTGTDELGNFALASAHSNGEIGLWSISPGDGAFPPFGFELDRMLGHEEVATALAFGPDGRIASGDFDGQVIWWSDVPLPSLGFGFGNLTGDVLDAAFVDGDTVVSLEQSGAAYLWDLGTFMDTPIPVRAPVWSIDAAAGTVAAGLEDGSVIIADADGVEQDRLGPTHEAPVAYVGLSDDAAGLISVSAQEGAVQAVIWDVGARRSQQADLPDGFQPGSVLYASDVWIGGTLGSESIALRIDPATGAQTGRVTHDQIEENSVSSLAVSGSTLATGGADRRIRLWDMDALDRERAVLEGHREIVTGIEFHGGDTLISSDLAGTVIMWDLESGRQFASLGGPADGVGSLELHEGTLLAASEDDLVWAWTLDEDEWQTRACDLAGRNMTPTEWTLYGSGGPYVRHCPFPAAPNEPADARDAEYGDAGPIAPDELSSLAAPAPPTPAEEAAAPAAEAPPATVEAPGTSQAPATSQAPTTDAPATTEPPSTAVPPPATDAGTELLSLGPDEGIEFFLDLPPGATLEVTVTGTTATDVDLFVYAPSDSDDDPTCRSDSEGNDESCFVEVGEAGEWAVEVHNFAASGSPPDDVEVSWVVEAGRAAQP